FFAQIGKQFENIETGKSQNEAQDEHHEYRAGDIEQDDQHAQLAQRTDAIFTDGKRDCPQYTEWSQAYDETDDFEKYMGQLAYQCRDWSPAFSHHGDRRPEQNGNEQHLQNIA